MRISIRIHEIAVDHFRRPALARNRGDKEIRGHDAEPPSHSLLDNWQPNVDVTVTGFPKSLGPWDDIHVKIILKNKSSHGLSIFNPSISTSHTNFRIFILDQNKNRMECLFPHAGSRTSIGIADWRVIQEGERFEIEYEGGLGESGYLLSMMDPPPERLFFQVALMDCIFSSNPFVGKDGAQLNDEEANKAINKWHERCKSAVIWEKEIEVAFIQGSRR